MSKDEKKTRSNKFAKHKIDSVDSMQHDVEQHSALLNPFVNRPKNAEDVDSKQFRHFVDEHSFRESVGIAPRFSGASAEASAQRAFQEYENNLAEAARIEMERQWASRDMSKPFEMFMFRGQNIPVKVDKTGNCPAAPSVEVVHTSLEIPKSLWRDASGRDPLYPADRQLIFEQKVGSNGESVDSFS